jgi:hypothetical protein
MSHGTLSRGNPFSIFNPEFGETLTLWTTTPGDGSRDLGHGFWQVVDVIA